MNKKVLFSLFLTLTFVASMASPVFAAKPVNTGGGKPDKGGSTTDKEPIGYDISYPQCGGRLPKNQAFGIVGVNGGNAAEVNPCLDEQLVWASKSTGQIANQPKVQLYVNTANPGQVKDQMTSKWPDSNTAEVTNPYGECSGANDQACSWQYGWDRAVFAKDYFVEQASSVGVDSNPANYKWWLDVETMNTWQTGSPEAYANNVAALEGWVDYYDYIGATAGLYSTAYQWGEIVKNSVGESSNLNGLDNWRPSGASLNNAKANCSVPPLTAGGRISLTQYVIKNLDHNYSCPLS